MILLVGNGCQAFLGQSEDNRSRDLKRALPIDTEPREEDGLPGRHDKLEICFEFRASNFEFGQNGRWTGQRSANVELACKSL